MNVYGTGVFTCKTQVIMSKKSVLPSVERAIAFVEYTK